MITDLLNDIALILTGSCSKLQHAQLKLHSIKSFSENGKGVIIEIENIGKDSIQLDSSVDSSLLDEYGNSYSLVLHIKEENLILQPFTPVKLTISPQSIDDCNRHRLSTLEFRINGQEYVKFICNDIKKI